MAALRKAPRRRPETTSRRRWPWLRGALSALCVLFVLVGALALHFYVGVTARFEGTLWKLPARIYSDKLIVLPGSPLDPDSLEQRLVRSGYARTREVPSRPGQFRRPSAREIELFPRAFDGAIATPPSRAVQVSFSGGRVLSVRARDRSHLESLELEPELLATMFGPRQEERRPVALERVPRQFVDAVLAAEDARFYDHGGIDVRAIGRAALANVRGGRIVQGGSTITQQTVKNLMLGPERTWWRKLREAAMSVLLDLRYSKDRILEVYLNEVYLGQRGPVAICGAEAGARFYFGRGLDDLSLGEHAVLAGMISSPGRYNPFVAPERAQARRDQVLAAMQRLGFIETAEAERARAEKLRLATGGGGFGRAPYVADFVRAQLGDLYPVRLLHEQGLSVFTTVDTELQAAAEQALERGLARLEAHAPLVREQRDRRTLQGALVVLQPKTGAVLALVGGRDYRDSQFNRAVQARRQPGSCFKPFVYLAGFENAALGEAGGLTPASLLDDDPLELVSGGRSWRPENYDGEFRGRVTARHALEMSLNVPTVRAAQRAGLDRVVDVAQRAGISSPLSPLPSLALGTLEVTPLELATAYATLAQEGRRVRPRIVREVWDDGGRRIESRAIDRRQAVDPRSAFLTTHVLQGVFDEGTARSARELGFHGLAAGKTGTTDETRDAWFVGYTPDLLALVWVGYDDNARSGLTGTTGALPIWVDFMKRAGQARTSRRFAIPRGIVSRIVDPQTGLLANPGCPRRMAELFVEGATPVDECAEHRRLRRWFRDLVRRDRDRDRDRDPDREPKRRKKRSRRR